MSTSLTNTAPQTAFIDIATYDHIESLMYGGPHAVTVFISSIQKVNWFSFIPVSLRHVSGTPNFGANNVAAALNRGADYVLHCWFRAKIPLMGLRAHATGWNTDAGVAWTHNLMHNLILKVQITFNELMVEEFDNYFMDCYRQFKILPGKQQVYDNMIGSVDSMTKLAGNRDNTDLINKRNEAVGDGSYRDLPLPFWFSEDSGVALPVAALPFNEVKINYQFRPLEQLVVVYPGVGAAASPTVNDVVVWTNASTPGTEKPTLVDPQTYAHYVVLHNDERMKLGDAPRDVLIHQVQTASISPFKDINSRTSFDIRFSHAIIAIFFLAENCSLNSFNSSYGREGSNYTTYSALSNIATIGTPTTSVPSAGSFNPFSAVHLHYENTVRYSMGSDYFAWTSPYYFSDNAPDQTGYNLISYSLKTWSLDPMGSTNFSKLANVSLVYDASDEAKAASSTTAALTGSGNAIRIASGGALVNYPQKWNHIAFVMNWNIGRYANGSFGHPSL